LRRRASAAQLAETCLHAAAAFTSRSNDKRLPLLLLPPGPDPKPLPLLLIGMLPVLLRTPAAGVTLLGLLLVWSDGCCCCWVLLLVVVHVLLRASNTFPALLAAAKHEQAARANSSNDIRGWLVCAGY
jgi:hypothetical protein